jgi:hypothetical protein
LNQPEIYAIYPQDMKAQFVGQPFDHMYSYISKIINESTTYPDHTERHYSVYDTDGKLLISYDGIPVAIEYFRDK